MSFFKSPIGGSKSTPEGKIDLMQDANSLYVNACELLSQSKFFSGDSIDWEKHQKATDLFKQASNRGLGGKVGVHCRWRLGNCLFEKSFQYEYPRISKEGLSNLPDLNLAAREYEKALLQDLELGGPVFSDEEIQSDLLKMDMIWTAQSLFVKNKSGVDAAISYLDEKARLIRFLGIDLPSISYYLGMYYAELDEIDKARQMFETAINAEDYSDELDESDFYYRSAQITKEDAKSNLRYLAAYGKLP